MPGVAGAFSETGQSVLEGLDLPHATQDEADLVRAARALKNVRSQKMSRLGSCDGCAAPASTVAL